MGIRVEGKENQGNKYIPTNMLEGNDKEEREKRQRRNRQGRREKRGDTENLRGRTGEK